MTDEQGTQDTGMLMLESLQLDVQTLQRTREEDKEEFLKFSQSVRNNFASIQTNFNSIQTNFERLFAARRVDNSDQSPVGQSSSTP